MKKTALLVLLLSAVPALGQEAYIPVTIAVPQIAVGGDPAAENYTTLVQIVNNNSSGTNGHIALFSDSGAPLPALFNGQGPQPTLDVHFEAGEARQIRLTLDGAITAGWMQITYSPSDALTTVILQFRSGMTLLSEVGVQPAFDMMAATDLAVETDAAVNTGIAIANPSPVTENVLVRLWDPGTGTPLSGTVISLPPNGHIARLLTELFPEVANITQIRTKLSLDSCSSPSCNLAGGAGLVATALRLNGGQLTTIPVADRPAAGEQVRYLPQVAFGGPAAGLNMTTILYLTTNVATGVFGTAEIFDNDGSPLPASADGAALSPSIPFTVSGNRVTRIVLSGDQTLRSGWVRLTLSGSVHLTASAVFQTFIGPTLVSEASVLESAPVTRGLLYVNTQSGLANEGVAFANFQPTPNPITLDLFNSAGFLADKRTVTLPPYGHLAQFVTEIFPQLAQVPQFDGALFVHSGLAFSAVALRLSSDKLAALPVALEGMYRPSIGALRITGTQRLPAQVDFSVDLTDFDSDLATGASTTIAGSAYIDFGAAGYDFGPFSLDGTPLVNQQLGTLKGSFQPPNVTGTVPSGFQAVIYVNVSDSTGNTSNIVAAPVTF
jgi:hypothetical protein